MSAITTRSRARMVMNAKENHEKDCFENNYSKIIDNLKIKLKKQEILNKTLLEEQETNSKEFEILCKNVQLLKKKAYEEEEKGNELYKLNVQLFNDNNKLKEDLELWENQELCVRISELERNRDQQLQENTDLHMRYSELLCHTTSSIKNGYKYSRKMIRKKKSLKRQCKKTNIKIKQLAAINVLMEKELINRENTVKKLRDEGNNLLEIIKQYEETLKEREITYDKVMTLEGQLLKLKKLIDSDDVAAGAKPKLKMNGISSSNSFIKRDNCRTLKTSNKERIIMFSDIHGRNMAKVINEKLPYDYTVFNSCMPHNDYVTILNDEYIQQSENKDIVILIGDYNSIKMDIHGYLKKICSIAKSLQKHQKKLIVTTISYGSTNEVNHNIMKINSKLFTIAAINVNVSIVEINAPFMRKLGPESTAANIAIAYMKGENCKNLVVLTKGDDDVKKDTASSTNFRSVVTPEVVK